MVKIKYINLLLFCFLIVEIYLINYISLEFHMVDDCIRKITISNEEIFNFIPENLSMCDFQYQDIYPQYFVKNYNYGFSTEIHFYFQDSWHIDGFMNITVHFNEYIIKITDNKFWQCTNCKGENNNYVLEQGRLNFYRIGTGDYKKEEIQYHFIFKINNMEELRNENFEVNKNYYVFNSKETYYLQIHYLNRELELINFNNREEFYINGNETLPIDLDNYFFHVNYLKNNEFNGKLKALGLNKLNLTLDDNYDFRISNDWGIVYTLTDEEINNRAVNVSIKIKVYNCPGCDGSKSQEITEKEFYFIITVYGWPFSTEISFDTSKETNLIIEKETNLIIEKETNLIIEKETSLVSEKEEAFASEKENNLITEKEISLTTQKETSKIISDYTSQDISFDISNCLDKIIFHDEDKDIYYYKCPKYIKDDISNNINETIHKIEIGKKYIIQADDYISIVIPIDYNQTNKTNTEILYPSSYIDFSQCEQILRNNFNISSPRQIIFIQIEINNTIDDILVNQIEYQAYDDQQNKLSLSVCNNETIKIYYSFKNNTPEKIDFIKYFKNKSIDILDINDPFFNDVCIPYSESGEDFTLNDRIEEIYKNYKLCENNCYLDEILYEDKMITCDCSVKKNLNIKDLNFDLVKNKKEKKNMNFKIIKCLSAFFSIKDNLYNLGFWIFLFLMILNIILLILLCCLKIKPMETYIKKILTKYGYVDEKDEDHVFCHNYVKKLDRLIERLKQMEKDVLKKKNEAPPKRKVHIINSSINKKLVNNPKNVKIKKKKNIETDILTVNRTKKYDKNIKSEIEGLKKRMEKTKKVKNKNNNLYKVSLFKNSKLQLNNQNDIKKNMILNTENNEKRNGKKNNEDSFKINLININVNDLKKKIYIPNESQHILNIYDFEEALIYDKRDFCTIYYIFLISKQIIMHTFLYKSQIEPFPLRLSILKFILGCDFALNAIFYTDDKISERHTSGKNMLVFALTNNIIVILLSIVIGYAFMIFFANLNNITNEIRKIFRNEENRIKKDKQYVVSILRKKEIILEMKRILKKFKIKVTIFYILEFLLMIFYWYYATLFCYIYNKTQISWIIDTIITIIFRIIFDLIINLLLSIVYMCSFPLKSDCLYRVIIFFYCFV